MLNAKKKEYFKDLLTKMLEEMSKKDSTPGSDGYDASVKYPDPTDSAIADREREMNLAILAREKGLVGEIRRALERLEAGNYGICVSCEEEIGVERLRASPVTTLCIECKKRQEEKEKLKEIRGRSGKKHARRII